MKFIVILLLALAFFHHMGYLAEGDSMSLGIPVI